MVTDVSWKRLQLFQSELKALCMWQHLACSSLSLSGVPATTTKLAAPSPQRRGVPGNHHVFITWPVPCTGERCYLKFGMGYHSDNYLQSIFLMLASQNQKSICQCVCVWAIFSQSSTFNHLQPSLSHTTIMELDHQYRSSSISYAVSVAHDMAPWRAKLEAEKTATTWR